MVVLTIIVVLSVLIFYVYLRILYDLIVGGKGEIKYANFKGAMKN